MAIKLIAIDLDDTLLDSERRISERNKRAIAAAIAQGITVTIATGRMYPSARKYAEQLNIDVPLITYNGGVIRSWQSGEIFYHRPIELADAQAILELFRQKGWYMQSYVDDVLYVDEFGEMAHRYERLTGIKAVALGDDFYRPQMPPTKMLALGDPSVVSEIAKIMETEVGDRVCWMRSKPQYIEIIHSEVNKGRAVDFLAKRMGIESDEVMAIGDSPNDLAMLKYAGLSVAMENADDCVKEVSKVVTAHHDQDGVAAAIEKYAL